MKNIKVVAAIVINDRKILCVQRGESKYEYISKKYEFPGGKIEEGETKIDATIREIREELKMSIIVREDFLTVSHKYPDFELTMHSYICDVEDTNLTLTEHIDYKWLKKNELEHLDWAAADIPIVQKLMSTEL